MERYYYDYKRLESRKRGKGFRVIDFLFPFLVLIVVGVVIIGAFGLFRAFYGIGNDDSAFVYIAGGQAQVKMWGTSEFVKVYSGVKVLQGDELYTAKGAKVVVEFFDGSILRMDSETDVLFNEIYHDVRGTEIQLVLNSGRVWVNKTAMVANETDFFVSAGSILVRPDVAVFDVENVDGAAAVRVVYGAADVDVNSEDGGTVVDHLTVSAGAEAVFDKEKLERFWEFQAPNVVEDLGDDFKSSAWFAWNTAEDAEPTDFGSTVDSAGPGAAPAVESAAPATPAAGTDPATPAAPAAGTDSATSVSPATGIDSSAVLESDPVILQVNGQAWDDSMFADGMKVSGVVSIKVVGKVSGAEKVFVNGYQLQKFVPKEGEESFVYWMEEQLGNLIPGENVYEVYATAPDGTRSESVYFKVVYEASIEEDAATDGDESAAVAD